MIDNSEPNKDDLTSEVKEYLEMRVDRFKLRAVDNLSTLFNKILVVGIILILAGIAFAFLAAAFSRWVGAQLNSPLLGAVITGSIFLFLALMLFLKRNTLFTDSMVKMFIKLFFENEK